MTRIGNPGTLCFVLTYRVVWRGTSGSIHLGSDLAGTQKSDCASILYLSLAYNYGLWREQDGLLGLMT